MKRKWQYLFVSTFLVAGLIGYFAISNQQKKPRIVAVLKGTESEYWRIIAAGMQEGFRDLSVKGKILAPDNTNLSQQEILKQVLKEKPDVLIYSPNDTNESISILEEYKKNNIPVLLVDTNMDWTGKTSFIGTDNRQLGNKAGELLTSILQPNNKVLLLGWQSKDYISEGRMDGAEETLLNAGLQVVQEAMTLGDMEGIYLNLTYLFRENPDIKGVFATDDTAAIETLKFLKEKNRDIPVVGADGIIDMIKYILDGTIKSTIAQNPYDMGYYSVENSVKVINGEKVNPEITSDVDIITTDNAKSKQKFLEKLLVPVTSRYLSNGER